MSTSTICRAKDGPANCTNPNCPDKRAARDAFYRDVASTPAQWSADALENDAEQLAALKTIRKDGSARTPIMRSTNVTVDTVQQHANLLAVVKASPQPITYGSLISIVKSQRSVDDEYAIQSASGESVEDTIHSIMTDLQRIGVVDTGPFGVHITAEGKNMLSRWGADFAQRTEHTAAVIDSFDLPTAKSGKQIPAWMDSLLAEAEAKMAEYPERSQGYAWRTEIKDKVANTRSRYAQQEADRAALRESIRKVQQEIRENPDSAMARAKRAQDAALKKAEDEYRARGYNQI